MTDEIQNNKKAEVAKMFQAALASPVVPRLYANGFICAHTPADIVVLMQSNTAPVAVMNLSYNAAKSLAEDLVKAVSEIEKVAGPVKTSGQIFQAISAAKK